MSMSFGSYTISVIVPTYNEEKEINELLENLKQLGAEEIIVADGGSSDRTAEIARPPAKVVFSAKGRGIQMNAGARASSGDVLLFIHADVRLAPGSLQAIRECMDNPEVVGGNFDVRFEGGDWVAAAFTQVNRWRRRLGIFYGDSGIFCRRSVFEVLGGYRPWPVLEDYEFARRLSKAGKLALLSEPIWVSDRRWRDSDVLSALWSWFWIQTLYFAGVRPERLARLYKNIRPVDPHLQPMCPVADTGHEGPVIRKKEPVAEASLFETYGTHKPR